MSKLKSFLKKRISYKSGRDVQATVRLKQPQYEYKDRSRFFSREFANEKEEADKSFFFS